MSEVNQPIICETEIAEWRALQGEGMVSAVGEYTPDEFWRLLDALESLRAENERLERRVNELCVETARAAYSLDEAVCELAALKAVPDGVEVVAYIDAVGALYTSKLLEIMSVESDGCEPLMTVAQHNARIVEKDSQIEALKLIVSGSDEVERQLQQNADVERIRADSSLRQPVTDNQQSEREAFEAKFPPDEGIDWDEAKQRYDAFTFFDRSRQHSCDWQNSALEVWQARAALSAPSAGQFKRVSVLKQTNVSYSAHSQRNDTSSDVSALLAVIKEILTFEDSNWHGSKGYQAGLLKAAGIVAALAARKAGGGDHE